METKDLFIFGPLTVRISATETQIHEGCYRLGHLAAGYDETTRLWYIIDAARGIRIEPRLCAFKKLDDILEFIIALYHTSEAKRGDTVPVEKFRLLAQSHNCTPDPNPSMPQVEDPLPSDLNKEQLQ